MKNLSILIVLLLNVNFALSNDDTTQVLFIGNSITYFNDMPQTFEDIANSLGDTTEVTVYAPGGTGFINHVSDQNVYDKFQEKAWDFIVLQPGSNESPGYSYPINETIERGRTLIDSIYKFNPCTQVLFYEISYGVWGNSAADLVTYNNTMDLIRPNLEQLADSTESFFAPVGEAFRAKWNNDLNDILWGGYGDIHPNAKGSYIAACTFYSSIFQKQVVNSNITGGIPANEALAIRNHTDTIVLNNLNDWRINTYTPSVNFDMDINDLDITFLNNSQNYDSLLWDFNDGSFSSLDSPLHSYNTGGEFNVSLSIFKNGCEYSITQNLTLSSASNHEINKNKDIFFSPNPAKHYIKLHGPLENKIKVVVLNSMGKEVNVTFQKTIDVSRLPEGIYFIQVYSENGEQIFQDKWLKQD